MTPRWYRDRHLLAMAGMIGAAALLLTAFVLGLASFLKMRQVVTAEFNAQQLVLARNLAALVRQDIDFLRRELLVLAQPRSVAASTPLEWRDLMTTALRSIERGEVLEARFLDAAGRIVLAVTPRGEPHVHPGDQSGEEFFRWALRPDSRDRVLVTPEHRPLDTGRDFLTLLMVTPVVSPATGKSAGVLVFVVDAPALSRRFTADARSGTTGYAWVLDEQGTFLAHPMADFIGKNAFTVRHEKDPRLGFEGINLIMRDFMLRGQEGVGEYDSGWHRQAIGPVRKLIAYCPILVEPGGPRLVWSVAVVAPVSEVHAMVRALLLRQLAVQLTIVLAIVAGVVSLTWMERYWSAMQREKEREISRNARLASLGTLAAGVAHEVNNPVAIILGFTDLLLERTPAGTEAHEQLRVIERQAVACKTIVENLASFARVAEPKDEGVDVNAELVRILALVRNTLLTEKIRCVVELEDGLPLVRGQSQSFQQVVLNLVSNSRAAMKSGGTLTVRTRRGEGNVLIEVGDTGHGIARRDLERIFDPFFTTKAPGEGTGLGLSISHRIVQRAGGTITVESRDQREVGPDRSGTTFRIVLPAASQAAAGPPATAAAAPAGGSS